MSLSKKSSNFFGTCSRWPMWAAHREAMEASRTGPAVQAAAAAGDWLRRIGHGKAKAGRPGATVKLKNVKTAFAACDVGTKRSPFLILLVLTLLARLGLEMGRPKNRNPFRSSPPGFPVVQQEANAPYNSLRADDGCPFMEHGRYSDTIENVVTTQLQEGAADGNRGISMRCLMARGTFGA
jgi:hypothetical protein